MNDIDSGTTLGELVTRHPQLARVFDGLGLDYCCGGGRTLDQACAAKPRPRSFAVEVVRLPDAGGRETVDERLGVYPDQRSQRTSSSIGLRGCVPRLESRSETESSAG